MLSLLSSSLSPTLTLSPFMIWYSGPTAMFLFLLARATPAFLPTALSVALRPLFPFRQAKFVQVFPLKPVPFCTLFAGLGSINKSVISLLFLSDSRFVLFLLLFYQTTMGSRTLVSPGTKQLMSWPDRERYLRPPQSLVVSHLLSLVSTRLFSDWRRTVLSKFFDTQVPSIFTEELVLPRHTRCVLSRLRCNGHSLLLGSYLSMIGRIENPS